MLQVRRLGKSFGGLAALKDVSLTVDAGEVKAVIGPNGAGKTTLFHLITGVLRPSSGEVVVLGHRTVGWSSTRVARLGVARSFQQPQIFRSLTVLENVMLGSDRMCAAGMLACGFGMPSARHERARQIAAADAQIDFVGLSHRRDRIACELPMGEQRYVELARALASRPKLLLLDEPAAGLDETETIQLASLIRRIRDLGVTVVLIEHHMKFVMDLADRILVLNFGSLLEEGTPETIRTSRAVIEAYLGGEQDA